MIEAKTLTLIEFLLARIADDAERDRERLVTVAYCDWPADARVPSAVEVEARVRRTTAWAQVGMRAACRSLGVSMAGTFAGITGPWLRRQALRYADHHDYRTEWRA